MANRRVRTHHYQEDPVTAVNHRNEKTCAVCYLPRRNSIHQVPETTQEARDRDAAVLGEKEDDE